MIVFYGKDNGSNSTEGTKHKVIITRKDMAGKDIEIVMNAGERFYHEHRAFLWFSFPVTPQIAVWVDDTSGNFVDTLYVTFKGAKGEFRGFGTKEVRRKEALPLWSHRRGIRERDGLFMPSRENPLPDAVTGASPMGGFRLKTKVPKDLEEFTIFIEVNVGFDFNCYYAEGLNPGDLGYNTGHSGQPAVVYSVKINLGDGVKRYYPKLVGHSSPTGEDGKLSADTSNLDTALEIIDEVVIEIK